MTFHDELVDILARTILRNYRDIFNDVFISNVSMDFPKPDFVYLPINKKNVYSVAFEVKTPFVYKHEYMTGLGQAIAYNTFFPLAYIVIPDINMDGFMVTDYIKTIVYSNKLKIGIFSYKNNDINDISLVKRAEVIEQETSDEIKKIKRSYSYWRETKPEEVFQGLDLATRYKSDLDSIMQRFWDEILSKRFRKTKNISSFLLNYKLFFVQNSLLDANGNLTILGKRTLELGERFGYNSDIANEIITYIVLKYGGHYLLLSKIYNEQLSMSSEELSSWDTWIDALEKRLTTHNYMISKDDFRMHYGNIKSFPRLPYAYEKYFCGIARNTFKKGKGLIINYPKIFEIMDKGRKLFSNLEAIE